MPFSVAVRAKRNDIVRDIWTAFAKHDFVVDFEVRAPIFTDERGVLPAVMTFPIGFF